MVDVVYQFSINAGESMAAAVERNRSAAETLSSAISDLRDASDHAVKARRKTNIRAGQVWRANSTGTVFRVTSVGETMAHYDVVEPGPGRSSEPGKQYLNAFEFYVRKGMYTLWVDLDRLAPVGQRERDREEIRRLRCELNDAKQRLAGADARADLFASRFESSQNENARLQSRLTAANAARLAERKPMSDTIAELRAEVERLTKERDTTAKDLVRACRERDDYKQSAAINRETADCLRASLSSGKPIDRVRTSELDRLERDNEIQARIIQEGTAREHKLSREVDRLDSECRRLRLNCNAIAEANATASLAGQKELATAMIALLEERKLFDEDSDEDEEDGEE